MKIEKQIKRIETLIQRLKDGGSVSRSSLKRVLGEGGLMKFDSEWEEEKQGRSYKPKEIVEYSSRLRKGLQLYAIAEKASFKAHYQAKKSMNKAEAVLEVAIEYLREVIHFNPNLRLWIDRDPSNVELCPEGVPRPIWSTSFYKSDSISLRHSKKEVARFVLEDALCRLNAEIGNLEEIYAYFPLSTGRRAYVEADFSGFKF